MARCLSEAVGSISTKVKADARRWASRFRSVRASHVFDGLTAAASLADMVTDILVLVQFHRDGLTGFFASSLCTLGLAQLSFAFLFTMEHTKRRWHPSRPPLIRSSSRPCLPAEQHHFR